MPDRKAEASKLGGPGGSGLPSRSRKRFFRDGPGFETAELSLPDRFRRHADSLVGAGRSPLSAALMNAAAGDLEAGGIVSKLFAPVATPPGSVPQLRLLGALHHVVLDGRAPQLAAFYPSAGGTRSPDRVWPVAQAVIEERFDWIQNHLARTVQTNEPGRSTVLYAALLWLTERYELPVRLLEIGASAGLNLRVDRYCHLVGGKALGDPSSAVRFAEPWHPGPAIDIQAANAALRLTARLGCDRNPLDPADPDDRTTLLSYIWPDELERFRRSMAAMDVAAAVPAPVERASASDWLPAALSARQTGELTVIWQSVFRQYVAAEEWQAIKDAVRSAAAARPQAHIVWLMMEPGEDHLTQMKLSLRGHPDEAPQLLAWCGDHGPPVEWAA